MVLRIPKRGCAKFAPFWMKKTSLRTPCNNSVKWAKKVTFLNGPNRGSKVFFFLIFKIGEVLRIHKRGCAEFAPFWMKIKYLCTPCKSVKWAKKSHFLKGPNRRSKLFFVSFFKNRVVLGIPKRGCAKFAPFWMKKKNIGRPYVIKSPFLWGHEKASSIR